MAAVAAMQNLRVQTTPEILDPLSDRLEQKIPEEKDRELDLVMGLLMLNG